MNPNAFQIVELGDSRLRQVAEAVDLSDLASALEYAEVMHHWMEQRGGVGIAAPQIGVPLQMMIIASRPNVRYPDAPDMEPMLLINPEPHNLSDTQVSLWEGCLSVPGLRGKVSRPDAVSVRYINKEGQARRLELDGFPARIFLHEYDHLIGKTFVDRVASAADLVTDKVYFEQVMAAPAP